MNDKTIRVDAEVHRAAVEARDRLGLRNLGEGLAAALLEQGALWSCPSCGHFNQPGTPECSGCGSRWPSKALAR